MNSSKTRTQHNAKKPGDPPAFVFVADARAGLTATFHRAADAKPVYLKCVQIVVVYCQRFQERQ